MSIIRLFVAFYLDISFRLHLPSFPRLLGTAYFPAQPV